MERKLRCVAGGHWEVFSQTTVIGDDANAKHAARPHVNVTFNNTITLR
jgi:hypothetical protein